MGERFASGSWVWVRDWRRRKRFRPYFNLSGDVKESIYFPISHPSNERTNERTKRSETISSSLRDGKMLFRKNFFVLGGREMVPKIKFIFYIIIHWIIFFLDFVLFILRWFLSGFLESLWNLIFCLVCLKGEEFWIQWLLIVKKSYLFVCSL